MVKEDYEYWGPEELPGFQAFWKLLTDLGDPDKACVGCRGDGGPPFCSIRKCARERGVDVCAFCEAYPCERVEQLARGYPTLIADGRRMREIGIAAWIQEQEKRAETGFAYVDIRCEPYEVPGA